jgi:excisionase family DNA binding protein
MTANIKTFIADTDRLLRVEQVADRLACGRRTVYDMINRGELPGVNIGRFVRVRESDLNAFVAGMRPIAPTVARF